MDEQVGQRFGSGATTSGLLATYEATLRQVFGVRSSLPDAEWVRDETPESIIGNQVMGTIGRPDRVLAHELNDGRRCYLAVWDGGESLTKLWVALDDYDGSDDLGLFRGTWWTALKDAGDLPVVTEGVIFESQWGGADKLRVKASASAGSTADVGAAASGGCLMVLTMMLMVLVAGAAALLH